jgi:CubicO group peptidase (beta-lactamase class C family)
MTKKTLCLLLFGAWPGGPGWAQALSPALATDNPLKTPFDRAVHRAATAYMRQEGRVGLSIGLLRHGRRYCYNYGTTAKGTAHLPTQHTVYELASLTKTFTATLLARAVVAKQVALTDDVGCYLREPYPNLTYAGAPVTLGHLTSLTSALPNWLPDATALFRTTAPDSLPYRLAEIHRHYTRPAFYRDLHLVRLDTVPGSRARHCNTAAQLLGYVLEQVYQAPFAELVRTQFTAPFRLSHTAVAVPGRPTPHLAQGYDGHGHPMPPIDWPDLQVAGGLTSCVSDMLRYLAYQLQEQDAAVWLSHQPLHGTLATGAVGFNWKIARTATGVRELSHTGGSFGFSSYLALQPATQAGVVLLANEADLAAQGELIKLAAALRVLAP